MVSELAGEGAMPPQLPTPASQRRLEIAHLLARLRQPIRKGSLLHRGVTILKVLTIFCFLIRLEQFFNHQGCYQKKRSESRSFRFCYKTKSRMLSKEADSFKLECSEIGKQLDRFYKMLRSVAFTESTTILLRFFPSIASNSSRSRSVKIASRVLVNPLFTVFNHSPWSRSMESVGESMSTVLINGGSRCRSVEIDDNGEELKAVNKVRRRRFVIAEEDENDCDEMKSTKKRREVSVFDDEEEQEEENDEIDVVAAGTSTHIQKLRSAQMKLDLDVLSSSFVLSRASSASLGFSFTGFSKTFSDDDENPAVVSRLQFVNFDVVFSTQLSNDWFNSNCKEASEWPRKGWRSRKGEFADLSDCCASAYKEGKFCETFHLNASGVSDIYQIVKMIVERKFQPIIIFSFRRRECEQHAMSMSKLDLNTEEEKDVVEHVFRNAVFCLNEEDRNLLAIELMLPLLQRGTAVHHSGLLPILIVGYGYKGATVEKTEHDLFVPYADILVDYIPPREGVNLVPRFLGQLCKEPALVWSNDILPNIPMEKLMVYHLNVSNFTKDKRRKLPAQVGGIFSGITEKLQHFKDFGVDEQKGPYFPMHFSSPGCLTELKEEKLRVEDALNATKAAIEEGIDCWRWMHSKLKDLEYYPPEAENYVMCFNALESPELGFSEGEEYDPPVNYKIPLRWPTGKAFNPAVQCMVFGENQIFKLKKYLISLTFTLSWAYKFACSAYGGCWRKKDIRVHYYDVTVSISLYISNRPLV